MYKAPVFENQTYDIKVPLAFRNYVDPGEGVSLWEEKPREVEDCFSEQIQQISQTLWGAALINKSKFARKTLKKALWDSVSHKVFFTKSEKGEIQYLFLLGSDDITQFNASKTFGMAVVAETTTALRFDRVYQSYYFDLPNHLFQPFPVQTRWIGCLSPTEARKSEKNEFPQNDEKQRRRKKRTYPDPVCVYDLTSQTAKEALFTTIQPHEAAWWHMQQENGGRRYIYNLRAEEQEVLPLSKYSVDPSMGNGSFRALAVDAFIDKWSASAGREACEKFAEKQMILYDKHHRIFDAWHGGKDTLTLIDIEYHNYITYNSELIQKKINECLGIVGTFIKGKGFISNYIPGPEYFEKLFAVEPEIADELCKIDNVTVKGDVIGIKVLWPEEIYCIPQLMRFEQMHNGIYGPGDRQPEERGKKQRTPVEQKERIRNPKNKQIKAEGSLSKKEPDIAQNPKRPKPESHKQEYRRTSLKHAARALLSNI